MSSITKTITLSYGSVSKSKDIKIDPKSSGFTVQIWFNKNMKKDFLAGKYGDSITILWYDNKKTEYRLRSKN